MADLLIKQFLLMYFFSKISIEVTTKLNFIVPYRYFTCLCVTQFVTKPGECFRILTNLFCLHLNCIGDNSKCQSVYQTLFRGCEIKTLTSKIPAFAFL